MRDVCYYPQALYTALQFGKPIHASYHVAEPFFGKHYYYNSEGVCYVSGSTATTTFVDGSSYVH